ncbi:hypothetical protein CHH77_06160 [Shouchella clausii]|nr:hypothetical protein CHH77_06160 [Shouchella clausii]
MTSIADVPQETRKKFLPIFESYSETELRTIGKFMSDLLALPNNSTEGKLGRMTTLKIEDLRSKIDGK